MFPFGPNHSESYRILHEGAKKMKEIYKKECSEMRFDPSMATTICRVCGKSHEAWCGDVCDDCYEKIAINAEKKMGLQELDGELEMYEKHGKKVILKFSSPHAKNDKIAADKMREFMDKNNVAYENDPECTLNRTIWISEEDCIKLFEEELRVKYDEEV